MITKRSVVVHQCAYKNDTTPDDESIDSKHVEKCEECKHIGSRTKIKLFMRVDGQR
jgi:hypothetical protein